MGSAVTCTSLLLSAESAPNSLKKRTCQPLDGVLGIKNKVTVFTFIENLFVPGLMLGVLHVPFFKSLHSPKVSIIILILYM